VSNSQESDTYFSTVDTEIYRRFADSLLRLVAEIEISTIYIVDTKSILNKLRQIYIKSMLERSVSTPTDIADAFIDGQYRYISDYLFGVAELNLFINLMNRLNEAKKQIVLANINGRLSALPRYAAEQADIPF
jgi:hypothetical protein